MVSVKHTLHYILNHEDEPAAVEAHNSTSSPTSFSVMTSTSIPQASPTGIPPTSSLYRLLHHDVTPLSPYITKSTASASSVEDAHPLAYTGVTRREYEAALALLLLGGSTKEHSEESIVDDGKQWVEKGGRQEEKLGPFAETQDAAGDTVYQVSSPTDPWDSADDDEDEDTYSEWCGDADDEAKTCECCGGII